MKRHVTIAAFVLVLAAHSLGQTIYRGSQDSQTKVEMTQPNTKLSKKERKKLEKEEKKDRKQERKEEKHLDKKQAAEQRKQYKEQEKQVANEKRRERKEQEKQIATARKKDDQYERKETQRAEKEEPRDRNRHIEREARVETASAAPGPALRYVYAPHIPVVTTATPALFLAQREVSHAIYSQLPSSNVRVILDSGNRIVLSGSAPHAPAYPQQALPNGDSEAMASALDPGSNACVNLSNLNQVLLTGQVASQPSAELIRGFAHQLASPSSVVTDQLAVRTIGVASSGNRPQDVASTSLAGTTSAGVTASANSPATTVARFECLRYRKQW
jgi:hypothetical protein